MSHEPPRRESANDTAEGEADTESNNGSDNDAASYRIHGFPFHLRFSFKTGSPNGSGAFDRLDYEVVTRV
jgi:hypothetical protein